MAQSDETPYAEKLRDPRWQKVRLEVLARDRWRCQICDDPTSTLAVHHRYYLRNREPWEYPLDALVTLCEFCHARETAERGDAERRLLDTLRRVGLSIGQLRALTTAIATANTDQPMLANTLEHTGLASLLAHTPSHLLTILEILNTNRLVQEKYGLASDAYRQKNNAYMSRFHGVMARYEQWRIEHGLNPTPPLVEGGWDLGPT
jgi:hypothetical protein